jgi:hypothetical protein
MRGYIGVSIVIFSEFERRSNLFIAPVAHQQQGLKALTITKLCQQCFHGLEVVRFIVANAGGRCMVLDEGQTERRKQTT